MKKRKTPIAYKTYRKNKINLIKPTSFPKIKVVDILDEKKIANNIGKKDLFGQFAISAFGNTNFTKNRKQIVRRTVPSGGCTHPTEVYFIFPKNSFYPLGVYHYDVNDHVLNIIQDVNVWESFLDATNLTLNLNKDGEFGVIYTSMVERAMFRYRDIRSTRAIFGDLGHIIQNAKYIGAALGFSSITELKNKESILKDILKLNTSTEPVLATQIYTKI